MSTRVKHTWKFGYDRHHLWIELVSVCIFNCLVVLADHFRFWINHVDWTADRGAVGNTSSPLTMRASKNRSIGAKYPPLPLQVPDVGYVCSVFLFLFYGVSPPIKWITSSSMSFHYVCQWYFLCCSVCINLLWQKGLNGIRTAHHELNTDLLIQYKSTAACVSSCSPIFIACFHFVGW